MNAFYWSILIVCAPIIGWIMGRIFPLSRTDATPEDRKRDIMRNVIPAFIWLPYVLWCTDGVIRWALLIAITLLYLSMIVSSKMSPPGPKRLTLKMLHPMAGNAPV